MPRGIYKRTPDMMTGKIKRPGGTNSGSFQKGFIPWNKGTHGAMTAWNKGNKVANNCKCIICKQEFYRCPVHIKRDGGKFCSRRCFGISERGKSLNKTGDKHWNWQGGRTFLYDAIRNSPENNAWRKQIFERDHYICQECGSGRSGNLNAHHLKSFSSILSEFLNQYSQFSPIEDKETLMRLAISYQSFWDIDNGKTLCEDCHKQTILPNRGSFIKGNIPHNKKKIEV